MIARVLGFLFLALGAIGIFLPIWPTTIFWILAALCFARSSPAMRDWIYAQPKLGPPIQQFIERGSLSHTSKGGALLGMAAAGALTSFLLWGRWAWMALAIGLIVCGAVYVLSRPGEGV